MPKSSKKIEFQDDSFPENTKGAKHIKNLKVKTKSKTSSKSKTKHAEVPKLKATLSTPASTIIHKSTKRVLVKTVAQKDLNPRQLRSGKKLGKIKSGMKSDFKSKQSPRTRSQRKVAKVDGKHEKATSKRKVISKLN